MKTRNYAIAILLMGFSSTSFAQSIAYASTTAVLVTPISISKTTDMHFGTVAASSTDGTVVLDFVDGRTVTGGVSLPAGSITQTTAEFEVTGEGTSTFSITIPTSITLTGSIAGTMIVDNFLCDLGPAGTLVLGTKTLKVSATLNVGADQTGGTYTNNTGDVSTGLFVTVNYN